MPKANNDDCNDSIAADLDIYHTQQPKQPKQQQQNCQRDTLYRSSALEGELRCLRKQYQGPQSDSLDVDAILQNNRALVELFRSIENSVKQDILRNPDAKNYPMSSAFDTDECDDNNEPAAAAAATDPTTATNLKKKKAHNASTTTGDCNNNNNNNTNNVGVVMADLDFLFEGLQKTMHRREKSESSHRNSRANTTTSTAAAASLPNSVHPSNTQHNHFAHSESTAVGTLIKEIPSWKEQFRPKEPLSISTRNDLPILPRQRSHSDIVILDTTTTTTDVPTTPTTAAKAAPSDETVTNSGAVPHKNDNSRPIHDKRPRSSSHYSHKPEQKRHHHCRRGNSSNNTSSSSSSSESSPFTPISPPHKTLRRAKDDPKEQPVTAAATTTSAVDSELLPPSTVACAPSSAVSHALDVNSERPLANCNDSKDNKKDLLILLLLQHLCQQYHVSSAFFMNMCKKLKQLGYLDSVDLGTLKQANQELFTDIVTRWPRTFTSREDPEAAVLRRSESESALTSKSSNFRSSGSSSNDTSSGIQQIQTARMPLFNFLFYSTSRFKLDFQMVSTLGKGGFGSAVKARHRIDGNEYAIKNVRFKFTNKGELERTYSRVVREVEAIARLDHPNVVRYYQAWFEPYRQGSQRHSYNNHDDEEDSFEEHDNSPDSNNRDDENQNIFGVEMCNDPMEFSDESPQFTSTKGVGASFDHAISNAIDIGGEFIPTNYAAQQEALLNDRELYYNERISSTNIRFESYHPSQDNSPEGSPPLIGIARSPDQKHQNALMNHFGKTGNGRVRPGNTALNLLDSGDRDHTGINTAIRNMVQEMYNPHKLRFEAVLYIQMALCLPITLEDWLWSKERISLGHVDLQEVNSKSKQIVEGLAHIHSKGVIHRDLKPSNLFLSQDGLIKIGDFGLSTHANSHQDSTEHNHTLPNQSHHICQAHTTGVGTYAYASPEQLSGSSYDVQVDIYSLGIILFEMLHLFSTKSERAHELSNLRKRGIISAHIRQQFPVHSKLIEHCIKFSPQERPTSSQLLQHDLFSTNAQHQIQSLEQQLRQKDEELEEHRNLIAKLQQQLTFLTSTNAGVGSSNLSAILAGTSAPSASPDMLPA